MSREDFSSTDFSGGDLFFRSGEGLARDVDGEGEAGRRVAGELDIGLPDSDLLDSVRIGVWDPLGGVFTETKPGISSAKFEKITVQLKM